MTHFKFDSDATITPNHYQKELEQYVVYPRDNWRDYLTIKLMGEIGEVADALGKHLRNGAEYNFPAHMIDEIGDVLFYLARLCTETGSDFQEMFDKASGIMKTTTRMHSNIRRALEASIMLDELSERSDLDLQRKYIFNNYGGLVLYYLFNCIEEDPDLVMFANLEKLAHRQATNNLKHS